MYLTLFSIIHSTVIGVAAFSLFRTITTRLSKRDIWALSIEYELWPGSLTIQESSSGPRIRRVMGLKSFRWEIGTARRVSFTGMGDFKTSVSAT